MTKYKSSEERAIGVPISMSVNLLNKLELYANDMFDCNRNVVVKILLKYLEKHKKEKELIEELKELMHEETKT